MDHANEKEKENKDKEMDHIQVLCLKRRQPVQKKVEVKKCKGEDVKEKEFMVKKLKTLDDTKDDEAEGKEEEGEAME